MVYHNTVCQLFLVPCAFHCYPKHMNTKALTKITHPPATLRDMVQDRLRDAIIEGHFKPGDRLVERPLCEQLGVSRTVIRETIRYLEAEGLVEILPGRGPIVATLSWDDARQIYEIRRVLETAAARTCAVQLSPVGAERLRLALTRLKSSAHTNTPGELFRASADFYAEIFMGAGHHIAWDVVHRLNGRISRLRLLTLSTTQRARPGPSHMQAICDAIISGDPDAAEAAVDAHLTDTSAIAERLLAEETGKD